MSQKNDESLESSSESRISRKIYLDGQFSRIRELFHISFNRQNNTNDVKLKAKIEEQSDIIESLNCEKNNETEILESFIATLTEKNFKLQSNINKSEEIRLEYLKEKNEQSELITKLQNQLQNNLNHDSQSLGINHSKNQQKSSYENIREPGTQPMNNSEYFNSGNSNKLCKCEQSKEVFSCQGVSQFSDILTKVQKIKSDQIDLKTSFSKIQQLVTTNIERTYAKCNQYESSKSEIVVRHKCIEKFKENGNVLIWCREYPSKQPSVVSVNYGTKVMNLTIKTMENKNYKYHCDRYIGPTYTQREVFDAIKPMVQLCLDGYSTCIISYGQSSSGKTYTIEGNHLNVGLIHLIMNYLFDCKTADCYLTVLEVYNEKLLDLLNINNNGKLKMKTNERNEFYIPDMTRKYVSSFEEAKQHISMASGRRTTLRTTYASSRSHCIYEISLQDDKQRFGSLYLVDLASSERVARTKANGMHLKEAQMINKSLTSLQEVLYALKNNYTYSLHRNSKLTQTLHSILKGSQTILLAHIISDEQNVFDSLATLNFSHRVRSESSKQPSQTNTVLLDQQDVKSSLPRYRVQDSSVEYNSSLANN